MKTGTLFIVNDRLDVALACGADGVHLGQDDIRVGVARQIAPPGFIIGVSVGTVDEAIRAEQEGADYIAVSPVFSTASKNDAGPGRGLIVLREIRRSVSVPVIAIGGITMDNVREVITAGADGVAVISVVVGSKNITLRRNQQADHREQSGTENVIAEDSPRLSPFAYRITIITISAISFLFG